MTIVSIENNTINKLDTILVDGRRELTRTLESMEKRDRLAKRLGLFTLGTLPNQHGYKFQAVTVCGASVKCEIKRIPDDGLHYAFMADSDQKCFWQLIGWKLLK
jgi:hypothetical protein